MNSLILIPFLQVTICSEICLYLTYSCTFHPYRRVKDWWLVLKKYLVKFAAHVKFVKFVSSFIKYVYIYTYIYIYILHIYILHIYIYYIYRYDITYIYIHSLLGSPKSKLEVWCIQYLLNSKQVNDQLELRCILTLGVETKVS